MFKNKEPIPEVKKKEVKSTRSLDEKYQGRVESLPVVEKYDDGDV